MTTYVQHQFGKTPHIVREEYPNGAKKTECGKWFYSKSSFVPGVLPEREQDVVCAECRRKAAWRLGKKVYRRPTLRKGLSEAKRYKLRKEVKAQQEQQRLAAWNRAAGQIINAKEIVADE
jgi:hypothetical protein